MRSEFKQNLIISVIGVVGIIIGASIGIIPHLYKDNNNELTVRIEQIEPKTANELLKLSAQNPKIATKEDGYISSLIDGISEISEFVKGVHIFSEKEGDVIRIRSQSEHRFSENLFIRRISQVNNGLLEGDKKTLIITFNIEDQFEEVIFEVKGGVLVTKPEHIPYFELEHLLNNAGVYLIKSTVKSNNDRYKLVETKLRYEFKDEDKKRVIEVSGMGIYYTKSN
jgi:hypothetical protein